MDFNELPREELIRRLQGVRARCSIVIAAKNQVDAALRALEAIGYPKLRAEYASGGESVARRILEIVDGEN